VPNLLVDPLQTVGSSDVAAVFQGKVKYRKTIRQVVFQPCGQPRGNDRKLLNDPLKMFLGCFAVSGVEDGSNIGCHLSGHGLAGHIRARVLLQVKTGSAAMEHCPKRFYGQPQARDGRH